MGFVFNFMTYGGHQIDGVAAEEFATALRQDGMLALARLQRKMRLVESPYRTPQTLVGGPRSDAALAASSGRTATTKAMGKGSTQRAAPGSDRGAQEAPGGLARAVERALPTRRDACGRSYGRAAPARTCWSWPSSVTRTARSSPTWSFDPIKDRHGRSILTVRDQNTFAEPSCARSG